MDAQRCVQLTDTNQPCGLTIISRARCGERRVHTDCVCAWDENTTVCRILSCRRPRAGAPFFPDCLGRSAFAAARRLRRRDPRQHTIRLRRGVPPAGTFPGGHRRGVTPVPIPNTEVKPSTADGTARVTAWESRSLPGLFVTRPPCPRTAACLTYATPLHALKAPGTGSRLQASGLTGGDSRAGEPGERPRSLRRP